MALEDRIRLPVLNLIHRRQRLLNILADFVERGQRLITVYAPSGYGKSMLLADFAQTTDLPVCWCSLSAVDRDPTSFLTLLTVSIADRFHEIEADSLLKLVARGDTQVSIRRICDALAEICPHLIIIDDYHKAVSAGVTLALNRLLEQLPNASTIIVAARGDMSLETDQILELLISERVSGLSEVELQFTPTELQRVIRKRFGQNIDLATAQTIARATHGNIAQILLAAHMQSAHTGPMIAGLMQRLGDDQETIYGFLAGEVFDKQPAKLQRFMLYTAVLPEITADLSNELLGTTDAQTCLEALVRKDLFITRIGAGFKYHDLFAEFLRAKLAQDPAHYRQVTVTAARLLEARAQLEEAINLYLSARAWEQAAALIETTGRTFYDRGRALTLNQWLSQISEQELLRHPRLLVLQSQILSDDLSNPRLAMTCLQQAEEQFFAQGDFISAAEVQVYRSGVLRMMGRAAESLQLATSGLQRLQTLSADERLIAYAIRHRGLAHGTAGNIAAALADLRRALQDYESLDDTYRVGMCHHEVGVCLYKQGNFSGADHHFKQAMKIWESLGNSNDLANTLNSLGVSLQTIGRFDEALKRFNESLDIAHQVGATRRAAFAQAGIGDVYLGRGDYPRALNAYAASSQLAADAGVRSLGVYNLVKQGECYYRQHNLARTLELAGKAREIAAETNLLFEQGLAYTLQGKAYVKQGEYGAAGDLFAHALTCLAGNDVLEQTKVKLWLGYSYLLNLRASLAFEQLQDALKLTLAMGELMPALAQTVLETQPLLVHFLHRAGASRSTRGSIRLLLAQSRLKITSPRPGLQFFAFGTPVLIAGGERKPLLQRGKIGKTPELLAYLLLNGKNDGCRWNEVSLALWPDLERERASINFHQLLKRLRHNLSGEADYIIVQDDFYRIDPRYIEWCDAVAFDALFEQAAQTSPDEALALRLELIALYQGEFLADYELGDWGITRRASYEARILQTITLAGEHLMANGAFQQALGVINRGLSLNYFQEDLHRSAFKAYAHLGLYDHLAHYYSELRQKYRQELDAPPDRMTEALYRRLVTSR